MSQLIFQIYISLSQLFKIINEQVPCIRYKFACVYSLNSNHVWASVQSDQFSALRNIGPLAFNRATIKDSDQAANAQADQSL